MTCKSNYRPVVERFGTKLQHKQHWWNDLLIKVHTVVTMNARSRSSEVNKWSLIWNAYKQCMQRDFHKTSAALRWSHGLSMCWYGRFCTVRKNIVAHTYSTSFLPEFEKNILSKNASGHAQNHRLLAPGIFLFPLTPRHPSSFGSTPPTIKGHDS